MGAVRLELMIFSREVGNVAFNVKPHNLNDSGQRFLFVCLFVLSTVSVSVELNTSLIWPMGQLFPLIRSMDQRS